MRPLLCAVFGTVLLLAAPAEAGRLEAAVIGNSGYPVAPLANAARDAATVAEALAQAGFNVRTHFDVTRDGMDAVLADIARQFDGAEISVLYYAGHAFQYNGQNELLSVDVDELSSAEIQKKSIALRDVLQLTAPGGPGAAERLRLVIVDACRNDPFSALDAAFQRGIAFEESGDTQTLIAYSTSAGQLAFDGPAGGNGPYALAFSRALLTGGGITVSDALRAVRRDVRLATEGLQIPWVVGSTESDPVLGAAISAEDLAPPPAGEVPELDEIVWSFVRSDLTADAYQQFVQSFPTSRYVEVAAQRMREIEAGRGQATRQIVVAGGEVSGDTLNELEKAREKAGTQVAYEPETSIPAELFAIWPEELPRTDRGLASLVTRCDLLASDPADPQAVAPPIRDGLVNRREAGRACGFALAGDPGNPRLLFQFGRVLQLAGYHDWARFFYLRAAAGNYSAALTNLGYMAIQGIGQDQDFAAAAEFYRRAAALGNLRARTNIGTMFVKGQGVPQLPEEGVLWYRLAAGMGWPNAQNALADLYRTGTGVKEDMRAAAALYLLAAENGQRDAMNNLGRSYLAGWGVEPDRDQAKLWFGRAIEAGDRFAPRNLALDLIKEGEAAADPDYVASLFQLSADRGEPRGYLDLASFHLNGKVVPPDAALAYLNARLAELREVKGAAELVARAKEKLSAAEIGRIEADIEQRRRLNGI